MLKGHVWKPNYLNNGYKSVTEAWQGIVDRLLKNQKTIISKGLDDTHIVRIGKTEIVLKGKHGGKKDKRLGKITK